MSYLLGVGVGIIAAALIYEMMDCNRMCFPTQQLRRKPRLYLVLPSSYKNTGGMHQAAPMESSHASPEQKLEANNLEDPTVYQTEMVRN